MCSVASHPSCSFNIGIIPCVELGWKGSLLEPRTTEAKHGSDPHAGSDQRRREQSTSTKYGEKDPHPHGVVATNVLSKLAYNRSVSLDFRRGRPI